MCRTEWRAGQRERCTFILESFPMHGAPLDKTDAEFVKKARS